MFGHFTTLYMKGLNKLISISVPQLKKKLVQGLLH